MSLFSLSFGQLYAANVAFGFLDDPHCVVCKKESSHTKACIQCKKDFCQSCIKKLKLCNECIAKHKLICPTCSKKKKDDERISYHNKHIELSFLMGANKTLGKHSSIFQFNKFADVNLYKKIFEFVHTNVYFDPDKMKNKSSKNIKGNENKYEPPNKRQKLSHY